MSGVEIQREEGIATVILSRGKVNALNEAMVEELQDLFTNIAEDEAIRAVILTGQGKFFSFGFDIPEFLGYSKEAFAGYLRKFSRLYTTIFIFPKPVVAALNGHTVAGGCMLASACDHRIMVSGKAKIALNEIAFGSSVFAGSVAVLKYVVGPKNSEKILLSGTMYSAEEAAALGLVDEVAEEAGTLMSRSRAVAADMMARPQPAFGSVKRLLRQPTVEVVENREEHSIQEFIDIWYSESTWENLKKITIG